MWERVGTLNLAEVCEYWGRWQPDSVMVEMSGAKATWGEFEERTRRIAVGLREHGVRPADRVGILGANSIAWCELVVGTLRAGAAVVPLNTRCTTPELAHMVDTVEPRLVAYDTACQPVFAPLADDRADIIRLSLDDVAEADVTMASLRASEGELPNIDIETDDPAIIAFTSGTTGHPKGAVLSHGNVLATINHHTRFENYGSDTKMLCAVPLAFTGGIINNLMVTYGAGGTLLLEEFNPARALEVIVSTPVTAITAVPIMYEALAQLPEFENADLSALTTAVTGGAVVPEALLRVYEAKGVQIRQAYSLTEATASSTVLPRSHAITKRHTAGLPCIHTQVRVADPDGNDVPAGETGEILVRGPGVFQGYWNNPQATASVIVDGWLHTGDLGRLDDDGFLAVVDRKKDMIISGGINVYPAEIERAISEFPGVTEVAAMGVKHDRWGETVAVIVRGDVDVDALYLYCRENLADYKVPRYIERADQPLPRSMSGKILRRVLKDEFAPSAATRTSAT